MGISAEATVKFSVTEKTVRTFRILVYGAYNAYGLIGSEANGILILDEDYLKVVLDEHFVESSGYFGPSERQLAEWERLVGLQTFKKFADFVNAHPRARYKLIPGE
jgi:hypothetical protein